MSTEMDSKKVDVEHLEPASSTTKKGKAGRHCKRWWWAWLLGFGIFVMVVMLIVVYGALPKIAQDKINDTELTLNSLRIMDPSPTNFKVSMDATIETGGGAAAHADLDPMTIELFLDPEADPRTPFMTMDLDRLDGGEEINVVKNDYEVQISEEDALSEFAKTLMASQKMKFYIHGRTKLWLGKLNTKVNYDEEVELDGLNHLSGMTIKSYELVADDTTRNMAGKVMIPNPTIVTIQMGDVNLQISHNGTTMGTGEIPGLTLTPGENLYDFNALIDESNLLQMASAALNKESLVIGSNGTYINGEKIPWLSVPLESLDATVPIDAERP